MKCLFFKFNKSSVVKKTTKWMSLLMFTSILLCGCESAQAPENSTGITLSENSSESQKSVPEPASETTYFFEPNISTLEGTLVTKTFYGPPGYGENPDTDTKETAYILELNKDISVLAQAKDAINTSQSGIKEIQIVPADEKKHEELQAYVDKTIRVQGTLFSAHTGHHHSDILLTLDKIE